MAAKTLCLVRGIILVAATAMADWRIGCSGYHYAEWKGLFYPLSLDRERWFEFYCEHFNTIELNMTFYKFPRVDQLKRWYRRSPTDFQFVVKAPRIITHFKKFKDAQKYLIDFYQTIFNGLGDKVGGVLFQFPTAFEFTRERLSRLVELVNPSLLNVVEFRHASWWNDEVYDALARHQIAFCGMSHPDLPDAVIANASTGYYRFHGVPHLYTSHYNRQHLEDFVTNVLHSGASGFHVLFNNTARGCAVINARQLQEIREVVRK